MIEGYQLPSYIDSHNLPKGQLFLKKVSKKFEKKQNQKKNMGKSCFSEFLAIY